jgi:hypothetical protein
MLIKSSEQQPRVTLLKRFPIPRNFGVSRESGIERGKRIPAVVLINLVSLALAIAGIFATLRVAFGE